jgi:hypothetical protein
MCTVASAPAAFRVRVWYLMSRGRRPRGGDRCYPPGTLCSGDGGREGVTAAGGRSCCLSSILPILSIERELQEAQTSTAQQVVSLERMLYTRAGGREDCNRLMARPQPP